LRCAAALLALLPLTAVAQDDSAVLHWRHDATRDVAGFRIYYGRDPRALSGMHQVLDSAARMTSVDGLADGTWYFTVLAVSPSAVESAPSNLVCVVIPSGSCEVPREEEPSGPQQNPVVTGVRTPEVRVSIRNIDARNAGFDLVVEGSGSVTIALAGSLTFDWCSPTGISGLPAVTPTTPSLGDKDDDGNRRQTVTFTAPIARTRCDGDGATGNAAFSGATVTVQGVSKPLVEANGAWSAQFP